MRIFLERIALVAALTSAPVIALSQAADPAEDPNMAADPAGGAATVASETTPAPAPVEGQIFLQSEDTILANDMIGLTVFSPGDEEVGDINDLIVNFDGSVEGVVIGVGGFLGIGEKAVAIELNKLVLIDLEGGQMKLVLDATREDLELAPAFKTARALKQEQEAEDAMRNVEEGLPPATDAIQ